MTPTRYLQGEPRALADVELLALALGGRSCEAALASAAALLAHCGSLDRLAQRGPHLLLDHPGVGEVWAARVHAALELGRRSLRVPRGEGPVGGPEAAWALLGPALRGLPDEELHALYLDRRRRALCRRTLTRGSDAFTVVDPRQVYREAVAVGAAAVVLAHNHPSGDPTPSEMDRQVTRRVAAAGRMLGVPLLDHLVVGGDTYTSLAELGEVPAPGPPAATWTC